jgi:hypothetical protein
LPLSTGTTESFKARAMIQREYESAMADWQNIALYHVMAAFDPLYAEMPKETVHALGTSVTEISDSEFFTIQSEHLKAAIAIEVPRIIAGDIAAVHEALLALASQLVRQKMKSMFTVLEELTEKTGNVVQVDGDLAESILIAVERMSMAFKPDGTPVTKIVMHPATAEKLREQGMTLEQKRRLDAIIERKRREYFAARRSRRLPRYSE